MRLLRVIASMDPSLGGVSEAVRLLSTKQLRMGHQVEVATLDPPESVFRHEFPFPVHALGPGRLGWAYSKLFAPWLEANLGRFDAVIVDGLWLYPSLATARAIRKRGAKAASTEPITKNQKPGTAEQRKPKLFVVPHGMLDPWFQSWKRRPIKTLRNILYWHLFEKFVINSADGILFSCEEEKRLARTTFAGYRPKAEHVVGLGIEQPPPFSPEMSLAFHEKCPALPTGISYLLFLSRIHEKKGVDLLIRAYGAISQESAVGSRQSAEKFPDLVIAGPGLDTPFGQKLLTLAHSTGLPVSYPELEPTKNQEPETKNHRAPRGAIHFTGMLQGDAKWGDFHGCDAFILPSHQENFGIVVAEALACGKPVLISDQVNIWREIEEAGAGLVQPDTLEGTTALLREWLELSEPHRIQMISATKPTFESRFHIERSAQAIIDLVAPSSEQTH